MNETIQFEIQDFVISKTAKRIEIVSVQVEGSTAWARYRLWDNAIVGQGKVVEDETIEIPKSAVNIITGGEISLEAFNQFIAQWNMTAIQQITTD